MTPGSPRIDSIRNLLERTGHPAWLFFGFHDLDPISLRILEFPPGHHSTRRWYYLVPAEGSPRKLVHRIEPSSLDHLPGEARLYLRWQELEEELKHLLRGVPRVAMQYSPKNRIPYVSRVDAGTVELIRSFGVEVVGSGDLLQQFESVWSPAQLESHRRTALLLTRIVEEAFRLTADGIRRRGETSELEVQRFILERFEGEDLQTDSPPIVAVDAHSGNPHYQPDESRPAPVRENDLLLIDLWARESGPDGVFADITWMAYFGSKPPARVREVFEVVRRSRDAGVAFLKERLERGDTVQGRQVDDVCRNVVREAGYGDQFIHRTGHNLGRSVHGNGVHFDNLETHDTRTVLPGIACTIEPGVYLPEFGIRSELNVSIGERSVEVTTPPQKTLALFPLDGD